MNELSSNRRQELLPWIILATTFFAIFIYLFFFRQPGGSSVGKHDPSVGRPLGKLQLDPLSGTSTGISNADLKGKVVLIDYWGPRCPPCKREFPEIVALAEQFKNRPDFLFVPVSCPIGDGEDELTKLKSDTEVFLAHVRSTVPTYQLTAATIKVMDSPALGDMYFISLPTTLVLDRQGIIRGKWQGYIEGYERQIADVVAEVLTDDQKGALPLESRP